jgi:hypothetical protein
VSHQVGRKARLNAALHSKLHFERKSERWRTLRAVAAVLHALNARSSLAYSRAFWACSIRIN